MSDKENYHQLSINGSEIYYGDDILKAKRIYRKLFDMGIKENLTIDVEIRRPHK